MTFNSVGIIGGGAWGTALAQTMCLAGRETLIWAREAEVIDEINDRQTNTPFLPGVDLDRDCEQPHSSQTSLRSTWSSWWRRRSTCVMSGWRSNSSSLMASRWCSARRAWNRAAASCWARWCRR